MLFFVGTVTELRKSNISFVMSVRLEQLGYHWTDFDEILYLSFFFRKSVEKIQVSVKFDKNNGHCTRRPIYTFDHISLGSSQNGNCFGQMLYRKSKHTFYVKEGFPPRKSCRLCGNVEKYCNTGQATDDNMAHVHCMLDA